MEPSNAYLSLALGWMSIACGIIIFIPQCIENYQLQSGEGVSIILLVMWLFGDITNLGGAILGHLLPATTLIGIYYILSDIVVFSQIFYYRTKAKRRNFARVAESSPLLPVATSIGSSELDPVASGTIKGKLALYALGLAFVVGTGTVAYIVANEEHLPSSPGSEVLDWKSQILGWFSAVMYLGSRIPQIIKNAKTKCAGLSMALFIFALGANATYVASILVVSTSKQHLITNASWLAGSGLTMFFDVVVLWQFYHYRSCINEISK